jgi:hypothetical protein
MNVLNIKIMQTLIILSLFFMTNTSPTFSVDFGQQTGGQDWQIINDGVMGGLSKGQAELSAETLIFKGSVSLENNGGFTSLRGPFKDYDFSNFEKMIIKYRSKGQDIAFRMQLDERWFMPNFKTNLPDTNHEWQTMTIELNEFGQYRIGKPTGKKMSPKDLADVIRLGFITNSKKASDFVFEVDFVRFE